MHNTFLNKKMATKISNSKILWYVGDFKNIWDDNYRRSDILSLDYNAFSKILSSEYLYVNNEYIVWKAIHDWVNFDKNSRLKHLSDLIYNCLRFGRLKKHFIDTFIFECDLFIALPDAVQCSLKNFINNVLQTCQQSAVYSFEISNSSYGCHFLQRITKITKQTLICIDKFNGSVKFYDQQHKNGNSSSLSLPPGEQLYFELALLGSILHALGGHDFNNKTTKQMWSCDLSDPLSQWTARENMNKNRRWFCSVVLNDTIYALGGVDDKHPLRSCERYDSKLNRWSTVADMNSFRAGASAAVINGCIYVAGGKNYKVLKSVSKYCPETDTWREVAPMITERWDFSLTPFAGRLWAIGGRAHDLHSLSSCESYDPVTDTWREEAPMKEGKHDHSAIEFNGELYVVGQDRLYNDEAKPTKIVQKYVPYIKNWVEDRNFTLQSLNQPQLLIIPTTHLSFFKSNTNQ